MEIKNTRNYTLALLAVASLSTNVFAENTDAAPKDTVTQADFNKTLQLYPTKPEAKQTAQDIATTVVKNEVATIQGRIDTVEEDLKNTKDAIATHAKELLKKADDVTGQLAQGKKDIEAKLEEQVKALLTSWLKNAVVIGTSTGVEVAGLLVLKQALTMPVIKGDTQARNKQAGLVAAAVAMCTAGVATLVKYKDVVKFIF